MVISGTKVLLEFLKIKLDKNPKGESVVEGPSEMIEDPVFSWYAHLIIVDRKKTIVLLNNSNMFAVVLHGIKAADSKRIGTLFMEAIEGTMMAEGINEKVIGEYLRTLGNIRFKKCSDRSMISRVNKVCESLKYYYSRELDRNNLFQGGFSRWSNGMIISFGKRDYKTPREMLLSDLQALFPGEQIIKVDTFEFRITLKLQSTEVWREISVPSYTTFDHFHSIIQVAFGWQDYHLHEFDILDGEEVVVRILNDENMMDYPDDSVEKKLEKGVKLSTYLPQYVKMRYVYDFGDYWEHDVELVRHIKNDDKAQIICIAGKGNTPPEDVGGEGGYEEFLEIMGDPKNLQHEEIKEWAKIQRYEEFDLLMTNITLRSF